MASSSASASASALAAAVSASALASLNSIASLASLNSLASQASQSAASIANVTPNGLQDDNNDSSFPHWAIAVIVILGVLAVVAFIALLFLVTRALRRRRANGPSRRGSMGSQSPMITDSRAAGVASPLLDNSHAIPSGGGGVVHVGPAPSIVSPDGASTHSDGLFSGADAAVMAEAFRQALRKPDFADRPVEEGESPDTQLTNVDESHAIINRQLAEEGTGLRSVDSSRDVKVETLRNGSNAT